MMTIGKRYWFYLEPYSFIFQGQNKTIIYNTLNSAYVVCPQNDTVSDLIKSLLARGSGYATQISQKDLADPELYSFIENIRDSFSGDILDISKYPNKPFIFKPVLRLRDNFHLLKGDEKYEFIGNNILRYLKEVSIFINSSCSQTCIGCKSHYKQFPFCTQSGENDTISLKQCITILDRLENSGTSLVKIMGGNIFDYPDIQKLSAILNSYSFKKQYYVHYKNIPTGNLPLIFNEKVSLIILVDALSFDKVRLVELLERLEKGSTEVFFVIRSEEEYNKTEEFIFENPLFKTSIKPFFDGTNMAFFEKNVFNDLDDIIHLPVDKKSIFRRQIVNEHFFGKLTIMSNGNIYSSINQPKLGNIEKDSLNKIVFKEIDMRYSWFKTRDTVVSCKNCCNKYLCPSLTDYEQILNCNSLCNMVPV